MWIVRKVPATYGGKWYTTGIYIVHTRTFTDHLAHIGLWRWDTT